MKTLRNKNFQPDNILHHKPGNLNYNSGETNGSNVGSVTGRRDKRGTYRVITLSRVKDRLGRNW